MGLRGSSDRYRLVETLFQSAVDLPPHRRDAFLRAECDGDVGLRAEIVSLLDHYEAAPGDFLAQPPHDLAGRMGDEPAVPDRIGDYTIIRLLGRGGMGTVYEAEQAQPRRRVALKVVRSDLVSHTTFGRFRREADVLGQLRHPGIAQIYEFGVGEVSFNGVRSHRQPFFAMELVEGRALDDYAAASQLPIAARLDLFARVCDAVQHAHQKGVIHRDLKPANLFVTTDGQPKVLDFGVARVTDCDIQMTTMHTRSAQLVGTLPYMSPEQVGGHADRLDTRSDVYALGVVFYELVAGRLPYDLSELSIAAATRVIAEQPPAKLGSVNGALDGDLESIAAKALEKDPARRYGSVGELAADVRRYLRHEPIVARPATTLYQMRMFARRNKPLVGGIAATFIALVLGIIGTGVGLMRAETRRAEAEAARSDEEQQRIVADEQRALAEKRADQTRQVAEFQAGMLTKIDIQEMGRGLREDFREQIRAGLARELVGEWPDRRKRTQEEVAAEVEAFERVIAPANPADVARQVMDKFVLRPAAESLEEEFADQPLVQAQIHDAIGMTYGPSLGMFTAAEPHLRSALELRRRELGEHPLVAESLNNLAEVQLSSGDLTGGEQSCREALALRRKLLGPEHAEVAQSLNLLAILLRRSGNLDAAEPVCREALTIARQFPDEQQLIAAALNNLGLLLRFKGDYASAEPLYREALAVSRRQFGEQHPQVASCLNNLGSLRQSQGDYDEAESLFRQTLEMRRALFGDEHAKTALSWRKLGNVLQKKGDRDAAEVELRGALALYRKTLGEEHADVASCMGDLAGVLQKGGDFSGAEELFRKALAIHRRRLRPDHPHVATGLNNLALLLKRQGDVTGAEPLFREALDLYRNALGDDHRYVAIALTNLARLLLENARADDAEPLFREALAICQKRLPPNHRSTVSARVGIAGVLTKQGHFTEAESMLLSTDDGHARSPSGSTPTKVANTLVELFDAWHEAEPDQGYDRKAALWRDRPETPPG